MSWHLVASVEEGEEASPWLPVRAGRQEIVLARRDGTWYGVEARCTHAGCAFADDATLRDRTIVCGCHGSEFDLASGEVQRGPAEYPLRTFRVRVAGGQLEVELEVEL